MFLALQFPYADAREFIPERGHRLRAPVWLAPEPGTDFVRSFGPLRDRARRGAKNWPGEDWYCDARRAIRFDESRAPLGSARVLEPSGARIRAYCAFRRFFFDGRATARLEIGLGFRSLGSRGELGGGDLESLLDSALDIPVQIGETGASVPLIEAAHPVAAHYLASTTRRGNGRVPEPWWLGKGTPLLLVEYLRDREFSSLPRGALGVETPDEQNLALDYLRIRRGARELGVWLIGRTRETDRDLLRRLRLQLFRLHAEQQTIRQIFRMLARGRLVVDEQSEAFQELQRFLTDALALLMKKRRFGIEQAEILAAAQRYDEVVDPGERVTLIAALTKIRPNLLRNVERYTAGLEENFPEVAFHAKNITVIERVDTMNTTNQNVNISGTGHRIGDIHQVAAETIRESLNRVENDPGGEELRTKLTELHQAVESILPRLAAMQQEELARDVKALSDEALSATPRRKWYELSAQGISEAAKTLGDVAAPVLSTLKAVLALIV